MYSYNLDIVSYLFNKYSILTHLEATMSGANQHYIPQMLLQNFVDKNLSQKKHTYKYDKYSGVFPKSIKKIASASYFNQDDAGNNADEEITKYENSIGSYFNHFSNETINESIDNVFCAKLVTHLILRTSHFREVFFEKLSEGIDKAIAQLFSNDYLRKMMKGDKGKEIFLDEIEQLKRYIPRDTHRMIDAIANNDLIRSKAIESISDDFFKSMHSMAVDELRKKIHEFKDKIKTSHIKSISKSSCPDAWVQHFANFKWKVHNNSSKLFILPDCVAIGCDIKSNIPYPLSLKNVDATTIALIAVTPQKLLIGEISDHYFDVNLFNRFSALCSNRFFISSYKSNDLETLRLQIGSLS